MQEIGRSWGNTGRRDGAGGQGASPDRGGLPCSPGASCYWGVLFLRRIFWCYVLAAVFVLSLRVMAIAAEDDPAPWEHYVRFVGIKVDIMGEDYSRDNPPYKRHVLFDPSFANIGESRIVGLKYQFRFLDGFGDVVHQTEAIKDDIVIEPGAYAEKSGYWYYEDDWLNSRDPYDKLAGSARAGTMRALISISAIALADGSVVSFSEPPFVAAADPSSFPMGARSVLPRVNISVVSREGRHMTKFAKGESFNVSVMVVGVPGLFSASLELSYDPNAVGIIARELGVDRGSVFVEGKEYLDWDGAMVTAEGSRGAVRISGSRAPADPLPAAFGSLVLIRCIGLKEGTTKLTLANIELKDQQGRSIPVSIENVDVTIVGSI